MEVEDEAAATAKASVDAGYAARPISCERLLRDEIFQAQMRNVPCHGDSHIHLLSGAASGPRKGDASPSQSPDQVQQLKVPILPSALAFSSRSLIGGRYSLRVRSPCACAAFTLTRVVSADV